MLRHTISKMTKLTAATAAFLTLSGPAYPVTATVTESISAVFNAAGKLSVPGTVTMTQGPGFFNSYTGSVLMTYRARTVNGATITMIVTSDFPAGGPSVAAGNLTYTCSGATLGTGCTGSNVASTTSTTTVLTVPANSCTGTSCGNSDPNSLTLTFSLPDNPTSQTGSYSANVQFTISAT